MLIKLADRKLIALSGIDKESFLQGLITNDVSKIKKEGIIFSAFLSAQGKFLADFFVFQHNDNLIIDINKIFIESFIAKLKLYKLNRAVDIKEIKASVFIDDNLNNNYLNSYLEPRKLDSWQRVYDFNSKISDSNSDNLSDYHKIRFKYNLIDGAFDLIIDKSYILEFGYNEINAISFTKGCYIGQEVTARTYHRGVIRKEIIFLKEAEINTELIVESELILHKKKIGLICFKFLDKYIILVKKDYIKDLNKNN